MIAVHPLAALIPEMTADQFAELRVDIERHGLIEPIVLHEHMILDGRHRARACDETGVEPRFEDFNGPSPVEFVISKNLKRRHLSTSQLAAIAVDFLPAIEAEAKQRQVQAGQEHGRGMDSSVSPDTDLSPRRSGQPARAAEQAGALVGVSGVSVARAKRVHDQEPEMFEQVKTGALTVNAADTAIRESKPRTPNPIKQRPMPPASDVIPKVLDGLRLHAAELDRALNEGTVKREEAADWSRDLYAIRTAISKSISLLKEIS